MRRSGVSAPLQTCNVAALTAASLRFLTVQLLDQNTFYFSVEPKSKCKELYAATCAHLESKGMLDANLFGLSIYLDCECVFVDPDSKISKYAPKNWKSSSTHGLDNAGKPLLTFYLTIQFYIDTPLLFRDDVSRRHYYLQLRKNITQGKHQELCFTFVSEDVWYLLAGLALQADYGDYDKNQHSNGYFTVQDYFPQQMILCSNEMRIYQNAAIAHRSNRTLTKSQAERQFIREASNRDVFPIPNNSHLYRMKQKKNDPYPGSLWLTICTRGIELYQEKSPRSLFGTLYWNNIGKLCFDRKKFEIKSSTLDGSERMTYYTDSDDKSKYLLLLCRLTHQFYMSVQSTLADLAKKEEEERNYFRQRDANRTRIKLDNTSYTGADQRISVISNTSSTTTSGIVSDRVHSLDESEDDLEMEIMINSPPAASIESLALAHLKDSFRIPRRITSDYKHSVIKERKKTITSTTPALTDGSQCSSSCSTVIGNGASSEHSIQNRICHEKRTLAVPSHRRHSTNSSLELGYSHTAQNSVMSDDATSCCIELDCSVQSAQTSSGVYTMQSSCETNTIDTANTAACSSETSGICNSVIDELDGPRHRCGSVGSTSGSFHGDGSDPSDTGHGTPLSAEELSDLIVGRHTSKPCHRGKYPSVATVSESLDSVADYVTLPPPPVPPPRNPSSSHFPESHSSITSNFNPPCTMPPNTSSNSQIKTKRVSAEPPLCRYLSEEAMLQKQIQFQHLAAGYSPQLLLDTLPGHALCAKPRRDFLSTSNLNIAAGAGFYGSSLYNRVNNCSFSYQPSVCSGSSLHSYKSCGSLHCLEDNISLFPNRNSHLSSLKPHGLTPLSSPTYSALSIPPLTCQCMQRCCSTSVQNLSERNFYEPHHQSHSHRSFCSYNIPVVGSNNYLDVRKSGAAFLQRIHEKFPPPPPLIRNRQPPPPPPLQGHLPCLSKCASPNSQLDQYRQQLYSDVDYVMYPLRDPAVSKQEYVEYKQALKHSDFLPPPPYPLTKKAQPIYRSTPNVAACFQNLTPADSRSGLLLSKYSSNQNLSQCTSSGAYFYYPPSTQSPVQNSQQGPVPTMVRMNPGSKNNSVIDKKNAPSVPALPVTKYVAPRRPPPPIPVQESRKPQISYEPQKDDCVQGNQCEGQTEKECGQNVTLDIYSLREKSRNLDLPLISALCNDRSLLKQTNTIDTNDASIENLIDKSKRPKSWHIEADFEEVNAELNSPSSNEPASITNGNKPTVTNEHPKKKTHSGLSIAAGRVRLCSSRSKPASYSVAALNNVPKLGNSVTDSTNFNFKTTVSNSNNVRKATCSVASIATLNTLNIGKSTYNIKDGKSALFGSAVNR